MTENNKLYNFEQKVKYSSNPDLSLAILSIKLQSKLNFLPEFSPIKIINTTNNKFTICKISYSTDSHIKTNSIYLSNQSIQSLKIKMYKKITIESISELELDDVTSIHLTPVNTMDYNSFTSVELWDNFIKPYFTLSNKICTIGDVLILNSYGFKVKFIVSRLTNSDGVSIYYGNINSNTEFHYILDPINSINEFYDSNKLIKFDNDTKKFELVNELEKIEKIEKKIDNPKFLDKKNNKNLCHYFTFFIIFFGLRILYTFDIWILGKIIIHLLE
jgi:hypothetical protein